MSLDDLLDDAFGTHNQKEKHTTVKKERIKQEYRSQRGLYLDKAMCQDLEIALNYALNTIRNKPDVKHKVENSTYWTYFQRWSKIREKIKNKLK